MAKNKQGSTNEQEAPAKETAASPRASKAKTAAKSAGGAKQSSPAKQSKPDSAGRTKELRSFIDQHPNGWEHRDWVDLLDRLRENGHDTSNQDEIGAELERERLTRSLNQLPGAGPRRVQALAEHFGTVWELRHASVDEIAAVPGVPRALAERVSETVR